MKNWLKILMSQFFSTFGTVLCEFVLIVWVYENTTSSMALSLLTLSFIVPRIILSPLASYLVDKLNRKLMLLVSEIGELIVCLSIIFLYTQDFLTVQLIIIINLLVGLTESFRFPAYSVITSSLLKDNQYARAHGLYMVATALPSILAPVVGGYLYSAFSITFFYIINLSTLIVSCILICLTRLTNRLLEVNQAISFKEGCNSLKDSITFIGDNKNMLYVLIICALYIFASNSINVILPVYILSEYSNGSIIYGNIETLFGIGGVLGAVLITTLGVGDKIGRSFKIGVSLSYLGMLIICYQRFIWVSGFGVIIFTIANQIMDACSQAWWQTNVPITKQGQIFAVRRFAIWLFGSIGTLFAGLSDKLAGIMPSSSIALTYQIFLLAIVLLMMLITYVLLKNLKLDKDVVNVNGEDIS
ncbi:MAG: MFS transporter [Hungatella sp.]|jgi:MFS family permease|nr:MFS transporter [Hungatella sp.]